MKKWILSVLIALMIAGCGAEWFPDTGNIGATPSPPPPGSSVTDVQADTVVKFLPYTVAGLPDAITTSAISVRGDSSSQYSINGGTPTNIPGTVKNTDVVVVQNTSSNSGPNFLVSTILQIGGAGATYSDTTGTLIFPTISGVGTGSPVTSNTAIVPATLPNGFIFGNPTTVSFASDSDSTSSMLINGALAASPSPIATGSTLTLRHTAAASSGQTVTTKAVITGSNSVTYTVTFKSTTQ